MRTRAHCCCLAQMPEHIGRGFNSESFLDMLLACRTMHLETSAPDAAAEASVHAHIKCTQSQAQSTLGMCSDCGLSSNHLPQDGRMLPYYSVLYRKRQPTDPLVSPAVDRLAAVQYNRVPLHSLLRVPHTANAFHLLQWEAHIA